jgi:membrane AbrB-like protein
MSETYGADPRLVATMQYVRLVCVIAISALVSHQLVSAPEIAPQVSPASSPTPAYLLNVGLSLALVLIGVVIGLRLPAGLMLCPLILGVLAQLSGAFQITLPDPLMSVAYAAIGSYVGLRFDRATLVYVVRKLPIMLAAALMLIALCAASAWLFAVLLERDYLSVFLATSPGGLDSLSIIAMESGGDVGLVVTLQTLRLFAVVLLTPPLVRMCLLFFERNVGSG